MSEHTKGRLKVYAANRTARHAIETDIPGSPNYRVAFMDATLTYPLMEADARRLVACWNACEGISTDGLEAAVAAGKSITQYVCVTGAQEKERDELIAALQASVESIRAWHSMGMPKHQEPEMWAIYWEQSPEMKPLRELLAKHSKVKA